MSDYKMDQILELMREDLSFIRQLKYELPVGAIVSVFENGKTLLVEYVESEQSDTLSKMFPKPSARQDAKETGDVRLSIIQLTEKEYGVLEKKTDEEFNTFFASHGRLCNIWRGQKLIYDRQE